jgi:membrane protein YqaA with SNARE-associated domain
MDLTISGKNIMSVYINPYKNFVLQAIKNKRVKTCLILLVSFVIITLLVSFFLPIYQGLTHLFWLSIISNTLIPLTPHEPILLLYGKLYSSLLVAIVATIAVSLIEFINYQILVPVLEINKIKIFREKRSFQRAEYYFNRIPFMSLVISCLTPIPFFPFRILAVTIGYSIKKFVFSVIVGRFPRYYVIAFTGKILNLPTWVYITVIITVLVIVLAKNLKNYLSRRRKSC